VISVSLKEMPPKLLTLRAPLHRDRRTLIWLQHQDPSITWSRWDAIVSNLADYHRWYDAESRLVGIVTLSVEGSDTDAFLEDLYTIGKDVPMILISRAILSLKSAEYWSDNFDNILCLDDAFEQYPFLLSAWDGTVEDAIAIFALLCRYNRLVDVTETRLSLFQAHIQTVSGIVPEPTWLITQFFVHPQKQRAKEIKECLINNCASVYIDIIVLLNETDLSHLWKSIPGSHKIKQIVIGKRLSYHDVLTYISVSVPKNVVVVISNADIYVDSTLLNLWKINLADRMLALLRWEDHGDEPTLFGPRSDSQDTWVVLSDSIKTRTWSPDVFGFTFGQPGCDSAFAAHMLRQRFILFNPALSIRTFHRHTSDVRDYSLKDTVYTDLYVHLDPTQLLDTNQEKIPATPPQCICNELVVFEVHSSSLSNEMTYCTMLEKDGRYKWEAAAENRYFEPAIPVYSWKNSCVTPNGLVYDAYTIYTGKYADDERFQYWRDAKVDIFTPLQKRAKMMAIPFADLSSFSHPDTYLLQYVSRSIRIREMYPGTSFWIPKGYESYVAPFCMIEDGVILSDEMTGCWAEDVVGFLPGPLTCELGREEIRALRTNLASWKPSPKGQTCVIVTDSIITPRFVDESITPWLTAKDNDWTIQVISDKNPGVYDSIVGASLCILVGGPNCATKWSTLWALPPDVCVVEFQQELAMDGEFQHMCHIADYKSWVLLLAKGGVNDVQSQIMEQLEKWYKKSSYELLLIQ
jgi:hypothetical protein